MRDAAIQRDADKLNQYVDFPALRESLRAQLVAQMAKKTDELKDNPFAGFAQAFAATMVNGLVDSLVTPEGMFALMNQGKAGIQQQKSDGAQPIQPAAAKTSGAPQPTPENGVSVSSKYKGLDVFTVDVKPQDSTETVTFVLHRDGLFTWKLKSVRLPLE
jgi:hypothetical protein